METDKSITAIPKVIPIIASETIGREIFLLEDFPFSMRFAIYSSVFKYNDLMKYKFNKVFGLLLVLVAMNSFQLMAQYKTTIIVGSEMFDKYLPTIKEKRVAIIGNQTSMVGPIHLVDTLLSLGIDVKKVFAPEHGFRGNADAGEKVSDGKDSKTGLPILSLYGRKNRKPSVEKLLDVDVVIFDIQDVGARFYTYISTMHYAMEACAEQNKKMIILDRPNPNGFYVDGPTLKKGNESFVGMHPVPIVHGMTIGEYAQMINGEKWLANGIQCDLLVVKCQNYEHSDFYELPIKPSPNLPNMASIYLYPSLCLFEGTNVSIGRGTQKPFQMIGSPLIAETGFSFTPKPTPGAKHPKLDGEKCNGYDLEDFGEHYLRSLGKLYLHWVVAIYQESSSKAGFFRKDGFFKLLTGDKTIREMIETGKDANEIWESFQEEVKSFKITRKKYLLYSDFE
jgi:uncharacterized protein YbbC (DUF1343 family)